MGEGRANLPAPQSTVNVEHASVAPMLRDAAGQLRGRKQIGVKASP
jgi:hypothetical protein